MQFQHEYLRGARQKARQTRDYFDEESDEEHILQPLNQRGGHKEEEEEEEEEEDDEVDPLDAFMAGVTEQVKQQQVQPQRKEPKPEILTHDDHNDSYMEEYARARGQIDSSQGNQYGDSDEEVYGTAKQVDQEDGNQPPTPNQPMEVLAPLDHSSIEYEPFRKDFYRQSAQLQALSPSQILSLRQELSIRVEQTSSSSSIPPPLQSFVQLVDSVHPKILKKLLQLGFEAPTAIQSQTFPIAMSGRDMIGIAKTGSGKTLAFTLPLVTHVMDQRELLAKEGPIAIILAPTRELAQQIHVETKRFVSLFEGANCVSLVGGVGKWDQIQRLRQGAEVVVATPGRMIEMIRRKVLNMTRTTFVVLDEADRMFELGFEPQLRSILSQIRPDRQTLLFSATFRKRIELLARDVLTNPVKIVLGQIGQANEEIRQVACVLPNDQAKWSWLTSKLSELVAEGRVLVFCSSKIGCEELSKNLDKHFFQQSIQHPFGCVALHGDKNQQERHDALLKFKNGQAQVLIATDVAARGLDIKEIRNVVNYDVAKNIDVHVHRIGRTGRMGVDGFEPGTAYTLLTLKESHFAAQLVLNMDVSNQSVPPELVALARKDPRFRRGKRSTFGGTGGPSAGASGIAGAQGAADHVLNDEEEELERWSQANNPMKPKAERRQGLGFASTKDVTKPFANAFHNPRQKQSGMVMMQAFRSSFVKATEVAPSVPTGGAGACGASSALKMAPTPATGRAPPSQPLPPPPPPRPVQIQTPTIGATAPLHTMSPSPQLAPAPAPPSSTPAPASAPSLVNPAGPSTTANATVNGSNGAATVSQKMVIEKTLETTNSSSSPRSRASSSSSPSPSRGRRRSASSRGGRRHASRSSSRSQSRSRSRSRSYDRSRRRRRRRGSSPRTHRRTRSRSRSRSRSHRRSSRR